MAVEEKFRDFMARTVNKAKQAKIWNAKQTRVADVSNRKRKFKEIVTA